MANQCNHEERELKENADYVNCNVYFDKINENNKEKYIKYNQESLASEKTASGTIKYVCVECGQRIAFATKLYFEKRFNGDPIFVEHLKCYDCQFKK